MKLFKNKLAVTIIVLSVAFLALIINSSQNIKKDSVSSGIGSAINPFQKTIYSITNGVKGTLDFFLNFSEVKEENVNLTKENIELKNKLLEYETLKEENDRLKEVLNYKESKSDYDYIGCEIIGYSGGSFLKGYIINRGENDGLQKDMIVISNKGLVGKITSTGSNWAIVQSILNENIAVSVMVNSSRENIGILKGYVTGSNKSITEISNIPMNSNIKEGDVIVTSGLGEVYPKEIRIGEVVKIETDEIKVTKTAIVEPYVDFDKLEDLFIVVPKDTREIKYKN